MAFRARLTRTVGWPGVVAAGGCLAVYVLTAGARGWIPAATLSVLMAALFCWTQLREPPRQLADAAT